MTALYAGILGLLYVYLALRVVKLRFKYQVGIGHGGNDELERMIRVHANFIEYVPLALILLFLLETNDYAPWFIYCLGDLLIVGRCLHMVGLARQSGVSKFRTYGMLITFTMMMIASVCLVSSGLLGFVEYVSR